MLSWPAPEETLASLKQNLSFQSSEFALTKDGVHVLHKKRSKVTQFFAPYESIGSDMIVEKRDWLFNFMPIGLVAIVVYRILYAETIELEWKVIYILGVFSVLYFMYLWVEESAHQSIVGGNFVIRFFYGTPSKKEVDQFVTDLFTHRKKWYLARYGIIDRNRNPQIQLEQFEWLKNQGILSAWEFEQLREELLNGNKIGPIGFSLNN